MRITTLFKAAGWGVLLGALAGILLTESVMTYVIVAIIAVAAIIVGAILGRKDRTPGLSATPAYGGAVGVAPAGSSSGAPSSTMTAATLDTGQPAGPDPRTYPGHSTTPGAYGTQPSGLYGGAGPHGSPSSYGSSGAYGNPSSYAAPPPSATGPTMPPLYGTPAAGSHIPGGYAPGNYAPGGYAAGSPASGHPTAGHPGFSSFAGAPPGSVSQQRSGGQAFLAFLAGLAVLVATLFLTLLPNWSQVSTSWGYVTSQPGAFFDARLNGAMVPSTSAGVTSGTGQGGQLGQGGQPSPSDQTGQGNDATSDPTDPAQAPQTLDLTTPEGAQQALAQLSTAAGTSTFTSVVIYPEFASADVPFTENPTRTFSCTLYLPTEIECTRDPQDSDSRFYAGEFDTSEVTADSVTRLRELVATAPDYDPASTHYLIITGGFINATDPSTISLYAGTTWGDSVYATTHLDGSELSTSW